MKKFLCSLLLVCLATVFVAGCGSSASGNSPATVKNGEWIEVYSITYFLNNINDTYYSSENIISSEIYTDYDTEETTKSEYDSINKEQNKYPPFSSLKISRKENNENLAKLEFWAKNPYYWSRANGETNELNYYKYVLKSYKIYYVKVRLLENNCIEINYNNYNKKSNPSDYNTTIRVMPLSYSITYFSD